jgi:molecular chaperone GrpE
MEQSNRATNDQAFDQPGLPEQDSRVGGEAGNSGLAPSEVENAAVEETVDSLREQIEILRAENDQQLRSWQRTQADFSNYRKRIEQEREELTKYAEAGLVLDLLAVVDDLARALEGLPPDLRALSWVEGVLLIERKLKAVLEAHGVKPIEAVGHEFDPLVHDAVMRDGGPGEATVVIADLQTGYRMHDRVLRPTLVKVGPPSNSDER